MDNIGNSLWRMALKSGIQGEGYQAAGLGALQENYASVWGVD